MQLTNEGGNHGDPGLARPKRTAGHALLLLLAIGFFVEDVVFLGHALGQAGHNQPNSLKFLVLTLGVFFTYAAALYGFGRRILRPGHLFAGLLLVQPAVSALANAVGRFPQSDLGMATFTGIAGSALIVYVVSENRRRPRTAA
jgi:hypothetical protein